MDNKLKDNVKKLLCYNIVNNSRCVYKHKCMFAHTLDEQKKEPYREFIYSMINVWQNLSNINIYDDKILLDELIIYTKDCKNCINFKCPGGYNCKFGACTKNVKICYNDLMYGKCYNLLEEENINNNSTLRCINGVHLSEKKLIPYYQRIQLDLNSNDFTTFLPNNINNNLNNNTKNNIKNNIISLLLNNETIKIVKDLLSNKINKFELIQNLKYHNESILKSLTIFDDINPNINNDLNNDLIEELSIKSNIKIIDSSSNSKFSDIYNFNEFMCKNNTNKILNK